MSTLHNACIVPQVTFYGFFPVHSNASGICTHGPQIFNQIQLKCTFDFMPIAVNIWLYSDCLIHVRVENTKFSQVWRSKHLQRLWSLEELFKKYLFSLFYSGFDFFNVKT